MAESIIDIAVVEVGDVGEIVHARVGYCKIAREEHFCHGRGGEHGYVADLFVEILNLFVSI